MKNTFQFDQIERWFNPEMHDTSEMISQRGQMK